MRRNIRVRKDNSKSLNDKIIMYCGIGVAVLTVVVFALLMYSKKLSEDVQNSTLTLEQMTNIAESNNKENKIETESASTQIGKSVEESKTENETSTDNTTNNNIEKKVNLTNTTNMTNVNNSISSNKTTNTTNNTSNKIDKTTTSTTTKQKETEQVKELSFQKPVDGEIVREFAKDNLIYSETLQEWVTHTGIDIKAEKTTVVNSAEAGTIKSIKNDPRYGLTIVIEHENNFQTVYSNLLTSEFVVEGEKVEKGQAIGTVGNTAVFEIVDEPHLHFEILKDSIAVDPSIYIK